LAIAMATCKWKMAEISWTWTMQRSSENYKRNWRRSFSCFLGLNSQKEAKRGESMRPTIKDFKCKELITWRMSPYSTRDGSFYENLSQRHRVHRIFLCVSARD
jgi:hypothetical protein